MLPKQVDDHIFDYYIFSIAHALRYRNDQKLKEYNITNRQARLLGFLYRAEQNRTEITNKKTSSSYESKRSFHNKPDQWLGEK